MGKTIDELNNSTPVTPASNDLVAVWDVSESKTKPSTVSSLVGSGATVHPMVLVLGAVSFSPADATTYFFGTHYGNAPLTGADSAKPKFYIPVSGTIKGCHLTFSNVTSNGSAETSTASIRLNDTTDTTITASVANNTALVDYNNTSLNIAVSAGDFITIKWVTPTWTTNPAGTRLVAVVYLEKS